MKKYNLIRVSFLFFIFYSLFNISNAKKHIILNSNNHAILRGEVSPSSISQLIIDINNLSYNDTIEKNNELYLYINSNGGSVSAGQSFIQYLEALSYEKNITCIADNALSMAFAILQFCKIRYTMDHSILMQHQISISDFSGPIEMLQSHINLLGDIYTDLVKKQALRMNMNEDEFRKKILSDWWIYGSETIKYNASDEIVYVSCDTSLTSSKIEIKNYVNNGGIKMPVIFVYSKCPLAREPLQILFPNNTSMISEEIWNQLNIDNKFIHFKWK